jgi:hypothetical protein
MTEAQRNPSPGPASLEKNTSTCPLKHYHFYGMLMIMRGEKCSIGRNTLLSEGGRWMDEYGAMVE